jgi:hypothetical protein
MNQHKTSLSFFVLVYLSSLSCHSEFFGRLLAEVALVLTSLRSAMQRLLEQRDIE